ncbi:MAG: hypothetical protein AAFV80_03785 [Bacteroidota bacterium]
MHQLNIFLHVSSGIIALVLGLIAFISIKGGKLHKRSGLFFLGFMAVVIFTGLIGVFVFGRNTFLLILTVLSGYVAYSGFRAVRLKTNQPYKQDIAVNLLSLLVLLYFLYYFKKMELTWSPVVIYSTVGALIFILVYDLARYTIPRKWYNEHRIWIYEHIYKMGSSMIALGSAASGTVFVEYGPPSQYLPTVIGLPIIFWMMWRVKR